MYQNEFLMLGLTSEEARLSLSSEPEKVEEFDFPEKYARRMKKGVLPPSAPLLDEGSDSKREGQEMAPTRQRGPRGGLAERH